MDTDMIKDASTAPADIPGLVAQARVAYQQNRIKECLALTKAALLVDPGNTAALEMQSAVRFDMQRDLSDARALLEESRNKPEAQKYRKAAEIILLKALYLDPDSEGAKTLLSSIRAVSDAQPAIVQAPAPAAAAVPVVVATPVIHAATVAYAAPVVQTLPIEREEPVITKQPVEEAVPAVFESNVIDEPPVVAPAPVIHSEPIAYAVPAAKESPVVIESPAVHEESVSRAATNGATYVTQPEVRASDPIPFTVGVSFIEKPGYAEKSRRKGGRSKFTVPVIVAAVAVLGTGLMLARQKMGTHAVAATASTSSTNSQDQSSDRPGTHSSPASAASLIPGLPGAANEAQPKSTLTALNAPPALPGSPAVGAVPEVITPKPSKAAATGSLAVSSPIAAEIYMDDKYLGSTPTTLQLSAGKQTVEYRHGDLRSVVTHVIKANETTTALVTFDAIVQLNAKPWANVFIEGTSRLSLGQTPLSDVRLPIGSVLVFENPNFPSKSHKIVADDKAIQMVFQ